MANYIANYRKRLERLERVQADLVRLIQRGAAEEKLLEVAAEVRECRIRALRAKQAKIPERNEEERRVVLKIGHEIDALRLLSVESILDEFMTDK